MESYNVLETGMSCTFFPVKTELPFDRNKAYLSGFSSVININFAQNSSIQVNGGSTILLLRKPQCVKQKGLAPCFPLRIYLPFERNTAYLSEFSRVRNINIVKNTSIQVRRSSFSFEKMINDRSSRV
jgi:hypothetical protein